MIELHPEAPAALDRLRAHHRLAIIGKTDADLSTGTVAAISAPASFVITAQQARGYKPGHRLFHHAHLAMGAKREETIHVGIGVYRREGLP